MCSRPQLTHRPPAREEPLSLGDLLGDVIPFGLAEMPAAASAQVEAPHPPGPSFRPSGVPAFAWPVLGRRPEAPAAPAQAEWSQLAAACARSGPGVRVRACLPASAGKALNR